ncbi:hypothetical protein BRARA_A03209 [Brassica rapa]|uniref:Myb/SANT-like DNA-binding domain-containing protein n=1 Tax=Brassica campestris TaxID=3711 RepID=A0A398AY09_BRACM|nr:hypothetical protein BRARA_A03209 [Brassica rapa]
MADDDDDQIRSHSDSPDPSSSSPPPPGKFTVTVASPTPPEKDPDASRLAVLPIKSSGGGGVLIDAWGEIHMELSRGNLKQKHWEKVAETVRRKEEDNGKTPKTDVQCKNRIDTVKKKYKQEKLRSGRSSWVFFDKLDRLIGSTAKISPAPPPSGLGGGGGLHNIPMGIPMGRGLNLYQQQGKAETPRFGGTASESKRWPLRRKRNVSDSHSEDSGGDDSLPPPPPPLPLSKRGNKWREVSSAIMRFGEAYEQIENAKLRQVVEMEKERLKFFKEVEMQRMQFFVKILLELTQLKQQREENGKQ